jgi:hypothetical protein
LTYDKRRLRAALKAAGRLGELQAGFDQLDTAITAVLDDFCEVWLGKKFPNA